MPGKKKLGTAVASLCMATAITTPAAAAPLTVSVFNAGKDAIFPVTSTIVYGPNEAMLVDAQFQRRYAQQLVQRIKATGKRLKYIFISHSDPDFYFGLADLRSAFPTAKVVSTSQTAYLIAATKDAKLQVWGEKLGADAPIETVVPDAVTSDELMLDGESVVVKHDHDGARSYLWIPSSRTILGGILVSNGAHLWMADTTTPASISSWLQALDEMKSLAPTRVIAGHFVTPDESPTQLEFVGDYLKSYQQASAVNKKSADIVAAMEAKYPNLPGRGTLEFGAQVLTGEAPWHVSSPYPPIGKTAEVNFGKAAFRLKFADNKTMSFEDVTGAFQGVKDTVQYTPVEIAKNIFMVYWHEPSTGANVVHVQDWNTGTVYTNIAGKDGSFTNLKGRISVK